MDWMMLGSALLLVALLALNWRNVKPMIENSPKGSAADWKAAIIPLALVAGFIALLVKMV